MSYRLGHILDVVEGHEQTLTLYNVTVSREVIAPIRSHFEGTTVSLRENQTSDVNPRNFAVLHEGETFIAACGIEQLRRAVDVTGPMMDTETPYMERPELLNKIDQSVFREYGKRRMILASRDIEKRAWRARPTDLHVGFQEFSRFKTQLPLYRRLTENVTVHLYGDPDWEPPLDNLIFHGYPSEELETSWFVLYDSDNKTNEPGTRTLLAQERDPNVYSGFWTSKESITDRVFERLQSEYPANSPFT